MRPEAASVDILMHLNVDSLTLGAVLLTIQVFQFFLHYVRLSTPYLLRDAYYSFKFTPISIFIGARAFSEDCGCEVFCGKYSSPSCSGVTNVLRSTDQLFLHCSYISSLPWCVYGLSGFGLGGEVERSMEFGWHAHAMVGSAA
jgi:hypothetical protein